MKLTQLTRPLSAFALCGLSLALFASAPASAQGSRSMAIMPTGYFSADLTSADRVTDGLAEQFEHQGYRVMESAKAGQAFQAMGMDRQTHYADRQARAFGKSMGADYVAYPRLLALGLPMNGATPGNGLDPQAVVHVRVIDVHTGRAVYFRQIGHQFQTDGSIALADFTLPQSVAIASAREVMEQFAPRVSSR